MFAEGDTLLGLDPSTPALCHDVSDGRGSWDLDHGDMWTRLKPDPQPESSKSNPAETSRSPHTHEQEMSSQ